MSSMPLAIKAITQFVGGTEAEWSELTEPVPLKIVTIATDTGAIKIGDGVTLYPNLRTLLYLSDIVNINESLAEIRDLVESIQDGNHTHHLTSIHEFYSNGVTTISDFVLSKGISVLNRGVIAATPYIEEVTTESFMINMANGSYQHFHLNVPQCTLSGFIVPSNHNNNYAKVEVIMSTLLSSTAILINNEINYLGKDGLIILRNQSYRYTFVNYGSGLISSLETTLL